ncbi:hypothetical protein EDD18DRAFT_1351901 [Armillaria luteobubalina]|uniref:Uncharacterized protein n=1 Tax=Armillaria luteobubalina TaxID=153913 RepID=A0AA39UUM2_9AGAR|nr:hypothetical protein EDD18DRAFT_1351901 [Armillaria luteobubalina]
MNRAVSPLVLDFLPDLFRTDDVNLNAKTTIEFVDPLFSDPKTVVSRPQDPEKLYELAKEGLPTVGAEQFG